jgi:MFS family permease
VSNLKIKLPPLGVFRHTSYRQFWLVRFIAVLGLQMQAVAIGWQVYDLARQSLSIEKSAFLLGMIGLAQFVPLFFLSLIGGQTADRFDRKKIIMIFFAIEVILSAFLIYSTRLESNKALLIVFAVAAGFGIVRAFLPPAMSALAPSLVPAEDLPQAIAWNSLAFQIASVLGPALGGALYIGGADLVYGFCFIMQFMAVIVVYFTKTPKQDFNLATIPMWQRIKEGLVFVRDNKIVLGAISLDLAVVLLAGATALLPVYVKDILHQGPQALGILRASTAFGAAIVAIILTMYPIKEQVGKYMFAAVLVFGFATIGFGVSRHFWLSAVLLAIAGGADMISVYVRTSLVQIATPDAMRGRVSAVSTLFISASNELGEFQSGVAARFIGPINAVVFGGIGAIIVCGLWIKWFKPLKEANRFEDAAPN